jgi:hypothetical protein
MVEGGAVRLLGISQGAIHIKNQGTKHEDTPWSKGKTGRGSYHLHK